MTKPKPVKLYLAKLDAEGFAALFEQLTGRPLSEEEEAKLRDGLAEPESQAEPGE